MKLSAPMQITWWIALALVVIGVVASLGALPVIGAYAFWLVVIGAVLLLLATLLKGL